MILCVIYHAPFVPYTIFFIVKYACLSKERVKAGKQSYVLGGSWQVLAACPREAEEEAKNILVLS